MVTWVFMDEHHVKGRTDSFGKIPLFAKYTFGNSSATSCPQNLNEQAVVEINILLTTMGSVPSRLIRRCDMQVVTLR